MAQSPWAAERARYSISEGIGPVGLAKEPNVGQRKRNQQSEEFQCGQSSRAVSKNNSLDAVGYDKQQKRVAEKCPASLPNPILLIVALPKLRGHFIDGRQVANG